MLKLDHIVFATTDLAAGADILANWLGTPLQPGGQHLGFGTHNRLLNLSQGVYLELIALDPSQTDLKHPAPFDMRHWSATAISANLGKVTVELVHAVAQTTVPIEQLRASLANTEKALLGAATRMTRGELAWTITTQPEGRLPGEGSFPTVIDWGSTPHPSQRLAASPIAFESLKWTSPVAPTLTSLFASEKNLSSGPGATAISVTLRNQSSGKPLNTRSGVRLA